MEAKIFDCAAPWRDAIPEPVYDANPGYLELYRRSWELVHDHLKAIPGMPQTPYMDEAFCDTDIWIWDTCFMALFCKYAPSRFPGVETLNNFYQVLHGGRALPRIVPRNAPDGREAQLVIHIADNPPLFAWAEYCNALFTGDLEHVRELLLETRYLQKHFAWFEALETPVTPPYVRNPTCLMKHPKGFFWEGGRSGMDNTPRGRVGEHAYMPRPNNPRMLWIDALAQQGLSAYCIARLAELIGEEALAREWDGKFAAIRGTVNGNYWSEPDGFYFDIDADDGHFYKVTTPASFWPLLSGMPDMTQAQRMFAAVRSPEKLGGAVPLVTLSRDDADFNAETGLYWRGSVWLPTAYMAIKGFEQYGAYDLARDCAVKIVDQQYRTFRDFEPHTVWECYHPTLARPANTCDDDGGLVRQDFCGWSALGPISLLIENVIGVHGVNAFTNTVEWALPEVAGAVGVRNLRFGDVVTDLVALDGVIETKSNLPYTLRVNGKELAVPAGTASFRK